MVNPTLTRFTVGALAAAALTLTTAPAAHSDEVAYLVNVTVRPGYNFAGPQQALDYGHSICSDVAGGKSYAEITAQIKAHFRTADEFQASYLISQAVQELCPKNIWQLRQSAAY